MAERGQLRHSSPGCDGRIGYSQQEFAERWGVSTRWLAKMEAEGKVTPARVGGVVRYTDSMMTGRSPEVEGDPVDEEVDRLWAKFVGSRASG